MKRVVLAFVIAAVVMLALDAIWLTTMSPMIYKPMMGDMLRPQPDMVAAGMFYVLYVFGVV